jgi:hypothetical protein
VKFGSQSRLLGVSSGQSLETIQDSFSQLVKGAKLMLHQNALLTLRNSDLEEQLAVLTKRKTHKRKYIQHGETLEFGAAAERVTQTASTVVNPQRRLCSSSALGTLFTPCRCDKCGVRSQAKDS